MPQKTRRSRFTHFVLDMLIGLGLLTLPAPLLSGAGPLPAYADDDDDDDDGGGGGFRSERSSRAEKARERRARAAKVRKQVKKAPVSRPVIVVLDLSDAALAEARRRGFAVLDDERLEVVGVRVQRLRLPRNVSVARARDILTGLGASAVDVNSIYRPQAEETCTAPDCVETPAPPEPHSSLDRCSAAGTIGLIETSVDLKHPALAGRKIDVVELRPPKTRRSSSKHGTAVTALIAGSGSSSSMGLLPEASVIVAVPYYRAKRGEDVALAYDIIRSIDALARRNPDVINMSLTGPPNVTVERALAGVHARGIPVVAAAGNGGARSKPLYPAGYDTTVAVTAVTAANKVYRRAAQGPHVDFAAPGVEVAFVNARGRKERLTGTSFAAPYVAAALAVLHRQDAGAGVDTLVGRLAPIALDLGKPGKDTVFGWGVIGLADICRRQD